jgi:hypothetical protein
VECVERWVAQRGCDRRRYEIIVVTGRVPARLVGSVAERLRDGDRLLESRSDNMNRLFDLGVRAASGRYVFFTEAHSIPEPDCLASMLEFLSGHPEYVGAYTRNQGRSPNSYSRLEDRVYAEDPLENNSPWKKVTIRGSSLLRRAYLDAGGFEYDYGHFCEVALGAKLHEQGWRIGAAQQAVVHHYGCSSAGELVAEMVAYGQGESRYRAQHDHAFCDRYFGCIPQWSQRAARARPLALRMTVVLLRSLPRSGSADTFWYKLRALGRYGPSALLGHFPVQAGALLQLLAAWAWLQLSRFSPERQYRAFRDLWKRSIHFGRLTMLGRYGETVTTPPLDRRGHPVDTLDDACLVGFHGIEYGVGGCFRWARPVALLRLPLAAGVRALEIELEGVRPAQPPLNLEIHVDGRPRDRWTLQDNRLHIPLTGRGDNDLVEVVLVTNPFHPRRNGSHDTRALGLALKGVAPL